MLLAVMHSQIAREAGRFKIDEVLEEVTAKLIRRHPHVFGESEVRDADGVVKQWEAIKREEKKGAGGGHYLAGFPPRSRALMRAQKAQKKAARVNFDWNEFVRCHGESGRGTGGSEGGDRVARCRGDCGGDRRSAFRRR